jgi:Transposase DDE domain/Transposase domain (DUF772)
MNNTLFGKLTQFTHILQQELFPRLEPVLGAISDRGSLFIAVCAMVPIAKFLPSGRWNGRPSKDRQSIARAFLAKSVYGFVHTRQLLEALANDATLRRLCGWTHASQVPHESTFSRAFAEFANSQLATVAHEALVRSTFSGQLIGHISRDSSAIETRERFVTAPTPTPTPKPKPKPKTKKLKSGKKDRKLHIFAKETQAQRDARGTRIEKQLKATTVAEMMQGIPTACDLGGKKGNNGQTKWWRGYKLHLDVADGNIPISALITAASVHDSQVAIPLIHMTSGRVTYLYDVMDSAYDAKAIRTASLDKNHKPLIHLHTRATPKTQLPSRVKLPPEWDPAEKERYKVRTTVERGFSRIKDEFLSGQIRVRGAKKVMAQMMFGVLALTVDQLLRLHR